MNQKNFQVLELIDENKEKWNQVTDNGEIYYKWQYVSAFKKNGDGQPYIAYFIGKNGIIYQTFIKRKIDDKYFDITTPYGYGGIQIEGYITNEEKEFFLINLVIIVKKII